MTNDTSTCDLEKVINLLTIKQPSEITYNIRGELLEKLIEYLVDKLVDKRSSDGFKNCIKSVLKKMLIDLSTKISCNEDLKNVFEKIIKDTNDLLSPEKYPELLSKIKDNYNKLSKELNHDVKKEINKVKFLFDTCYDKGRADNLKDDLEKILDVFSSDDNKYAFITLLATAYIGAASKFEVNRDVEWLFELIRTYLSRVKERNIEFTLCPSKGDAAAVTYYAILKLKEAEIDSVKIDLELIKEFVGRILSPQKTSSGGREGAGNRGAGGS